MFTEDHEFPEPPEVVAYLSADGMSLIVPCCPHCGHKHTHGSGGDPRDPAYGHRNGHCVGLRNPGYMLVAPREGQAPVPALRRTSSSAPEKRRKTRAATKR